jgi:hypothetical protein
MGGVVENYSKFEACAVVRFMQAGRMGQSGIRRRLDSVYYQNVFSRNIEFKECQMAVNDDPEKHRGRPKTSHTD